MNRLQKSVGKSQITMSIPKKARERFGRSTRSARQEDRKSRQTQVSASYRHRLVVAVSVLKKYASRSIISDVQKARSGSFKPVKIHRTPLEHCELPILTQAFTKVQQPL